MPCLSPIMGFSRLREFFDITVRIGPLRLSHVFSSFPLVSGA